MADASRLSAIDQGGRLLLVVLAALLSLASACGGVDTELPPQGLSVLHYDIDLSVDVDRLTVEGRATIRFVGESDTLRLTLDGPSVDSVTIGGRGVRFSHRKGVLLVHSGTGGDTSEVAVYYRGRPARGLYAGEIDRQRVVYTDGWPTRISGWMPGVHHPSQPASLTLELRHPPGHIAAASGRAIERGETYSRWQLDARAPTYSFAFALGPFERRSDDDSELPITHYHIGGTTTGADVLDGSRDMVTIFERMLGIYPYQSLSTVPVPFGFAGMENASSAFLNADLYGDQDALVEVLAHEIAHQWFGNTITIADWKDLWISEGFTTYLSTMLFERIDGPDAARGHLVRLALLETAQARSAPAIVPVEIQSPDDMLSWVVYRKAGSMLHALRLRVGDDVFLEGLRTIVERHSQRPASTAEVVSIFSAVSATNLGDFFDFWLSERTFPRLALRWDASASVLSWDVRDDGGALDEVDFELEITIDDDVWYVNRKETSIELHGVRKLPVVRSVGVMLDIRWET